MRVFYLLLDSIILITEQATYLVGNKRFYLLLDIIALRALLLPLHKMINLHVITRLCHFKSWFQGMIMCIITFLI